MILRPLLLCIFGVLTATLLHCPSSTTSAASIAVAAAAAEEEQEEVDDNDEIINKNKSKKKKKKKDGVLFMYNSMTPEERYPVEEFGEPPLNEDGNPIKLLPDFLNGTKGNRVVEFYASWCPKCQYYKSFYIQFARNMTQRAKEEYDLDDITFHAISCTRHKKMCRRRGVDSYPTIELIPDGQRNGTLLSSWQLHPFTVFKEFGVLEEDYLMGKENDDDDDTSLLLQQAMESQRRAAARDGHGIGDDATINRFDKYPRSKETMYNDAYLSFDFAMRDGIFKNDEPLSANLELSEAFNSWIETLNMALPPLWKLHDPVHLILEEWDAVVSKEDNLISVVDRHKPPIETWSDSCKKGNEAMGYTCGLWYLFHVMTVGVAEWNTHSSDETQRFALSEVGDHLADYIENFFGCAECRQHFLADYNKCVHGLCDRLGEETADDTDWRQLPLWLWEMHNSVNVRLMKERAARDGTPEVNEKLVQWPSRDACPICWKDDSSSSSSGSYDPEAVWKYLRMEYWPDDATTRSFREELLQSMTSAGGGTTTNTVAAQADDEL